MKSFPGGPSKDRNSARTVIANVVTRQLLRFHNRPLYEIASRWLVEMAACVVSGSSH
jgi:hypothetical protein